MTGKALDPVAPKTSNPDPLAVDLTGSSLGDRLTALAVTMGFIKERTEKTADQLGDILVEIRTVTNTLVRHEELIQQHGRQIADVQKIADETRTWVDENKKLPERVTTHGTKIDDLTKSSVRWDIVYFFASTIIAVAVSRIAGGIWPQ